MIRPPVQITDQTTRSDANLDPAGLPQLDAIVEATAAGVHTPAWICATYGIDLGTYRAIMALPEIAARVAEVRRALYTNPTPARIRRKAAVAVEAALPTIVDTVHDQSLPAAARMTAMAELARLAGVRNETAESRAVTNADRVVVNIVLSDETVSLRARTIEGSATEDTTETNE